MSSTLLTTLPPVVHIISTELEIPLTAVTVQSSVSGSPIVRLPNVPFPREVPFPIEVLFPEDS